MATIAAFDVNSDDWTPYVVDRVCRRVMVREVGQEGTVTYYIAHPTQYDPALTCPAGKEYVYGGIDPRVFFYPGQILFYIKTALDGETPTSADFDGDEQ